MVQKKIQKNREVTWKKAHRGESCERNGDSSSSISMCTAAPEPQRTTGRPAAVSLWCDSPLLSSGEDPAELRESETEGSRHRGRTGGDG